MFTPTSTFTIHAEKCTLAIQSGNAALAGWEARQAVQYARVECAREMGNDHHVLFETRMMAARELLYSAEEVDVKAAIRRARVAQSKVARTHRALKLAAVAERKAKYQEYLQIAKEAA